MAVVYNTLGKQLIVDRIDDTASGANTDYVSGGTGAGGAAVGNTTLSTEVGEARASCTKSQSAADTNQWQGTQTYTGSHTITNAGVFDAAASGTLILSADSLSIAVGDGDAILYTFRLQQT